MNAAASGSFSRNLWILIRILGKQLALRVTDRFCQRHELVFWFDAVSWYRGICLIGRRGKRPFVRCRNLNFGEDGVSS